MKILRFNQVRVLTGLSRTTLWRYEKSGTVPRRRLLGTKIIGWLSSEIEVVIKMHQSGMGQTPENRGARRSQVRDLEDLVIRLFICVTSLRYFSKHNAEIQAMLCSDEVVNPKVEAAEAALHEYLDVLVKTITKRKK